MLLSEQATADLESALAGIDAGVKELRKATAEIADKNSGTLWATIMYDKGEGKRLRDTLSKLESDLAKIGEVAREALSSTDGPLGYLLNDPEGRARLETIVRNLSDPNGGTLGRLINDDTVVRDLEAMLQEFTEAGRVARENAPLGNLVSFTALFFSILN